MLLKPFRMQKTFTGCLKLGPCFSTQQVLNSCVVFVLSCSDAGLPRKGFGLQFAPLNVPLERRLQTLAVVYFLTCFIVMGMFIIIIGIYLVFTDYYWVTLLTVSWVYYDRKTPHRGGRRLPWLRLRSVDQWRYVRDFFPITLVKTVDLDPKHNYLLAVHPHGIISIGAMINFGTEVTGFSKLFPGITPSLLTLSGWFYVPLVREFVMMAGKETYGAAIFIYPHPNQCKPNRGCKEKNSLVPF